MDTLCAPRGPRRAELIGADLREHASPPRLASRASKAGINNPTSDPAPCFFTCAFSPLLSLSLSLSLSFSLSFSSSFSRAATLIAPGSLDPSERDATRASRKFRNEAHARVRQGLGAKCITHNSGPTARIKGKHPFTSKRTASPPSPGESDRKVADRDYAASARVISLNGAGIRHRVIRFICVHVSRVMIHR